ncbi:MAG: lamin tail domain-containing protein [Sandaracinaceae bacterium]|nr:lamin tail domain-containing protein [Sandaracinaceae bacterium]
MQSKLSLLVLGLVLAGRAHAHPVTVDGDISDWIARAPASANLGIVARDATQRGELVWTDAGGDARTDLGDASQVDLTSFAVTADATNLYFRGSIAGTLVTIDPASAPQIQIAIDLDRTTGSGQSFFAAFADTTVAEDARWEWLVRTRINGLIPSVEVLDTTFAVVGTGSFAFSNGGSGATIELRVPWAALGRTGPPPVLRLSVATFRENTSTGNTVDIGGAGTSNALDVISDGGNPVPSGFPNAWDQELNDMDVDYFVDAWLDADGDVYAPLAVTRVLQSGTNVEWIEVRNNTGATLDLAAFAAGDEEAVDGGEGMFRFPAGTTLAAGATFVVALNGSTFATTYGRPADAELSSTDATPNMVRDTTWVTAGGNVNLAADDEVLVLGIGHTIVDVITWGVGAYPGITDLVAAPTDVVAYRDPDTLDTDRGADFAAADDCTVAAPCGSQCQSCARLICEAIPAGGSCEDGNLCTGGETCNASGACGGGSPISCNDGNVCTTDSCAPATGCVSAPAPGTTCNDSNACTSGDVCSATATCAGTAISCDDSNVCTADSCDPASGCVRTPTPGASCADANLCNGSETCSATGMCMPGTALACDDGDQCTSDSCVPATGCANVVMAGASCADGNACTEGDTCDASGACAGTALDCDDANPCTADACDMAAGCMSTPTPGVACADADLCNGNEVCDATGACMAGTALDCDDANACTIDSCAAASGCAHDPDEGASCDDGDPCTSGETCDATGACGGGTSVPMCDAGPPELDAGTREDASVQRDGGSMAGDAGADGGPDILERGGCGCRAGTREGRGLGGIAIACMIAVAARRRRR